MRLPSAENSMVCPRGVRRLGLFASRRNAVNGPAWGRGGHGAPARGTRRKSFVGGGWGGARGGMGVGAPSRAVGPLSVPKDAIVMDTTHLSQGEVIDQIVQRVQSSSSSSTKSGRAR